MPISIRLPTNDSSPTTRWLSLREAASLLGVHPTTLRAWADAGQIQVVRTPGGHRRFAEEDVKRLLVPERGQAVATLMPVASDWVSGRSPGDADQALLPAANGLQSNLLQKARADLADEHDHAEHWLLAFDEEQRHIQRETGRRLLGLAIQYMVRDRKRKQILIEGQTLAAWYGTRAAVQGLSLPDMTRAFMFFRDSLGDAVAAQAPDLEGESLNLRLRQFMDEVLFAALEAYETTRQAAVDEPQSRP